MEVHGKLEKLARENNLDCTSKDFATMMDKNDELKTFRNRFHIPKMKDLSNETNQSLHNENDLAVYMCGNSLGLQPKTTNQFVQKVLKDWKDYGVLCHEKGSFPAAKCDQSPKDFLVDIVGAKYPREISVLNGLTVNIHLLLTAFYRPDPKGRYKILMEDHAFRSDRYAVTSHMDQKGINIRDALIEIQPKNDEPWIRTQAILDVIEENKDSIAIILLSGVQYYTGQKFDMEKGTKFAKSRGCLVGWDLAHAVGNVELKLHEWDVDFAAWCSYKYLNAGAGNIAGIFVHDRFCLKMPQYLHGWFGTLDKFDMFKKYIPIAGTDCMRLSNPPPLLIAAQYAGLQITAEAGMGRITKKQELLTGYLDYLIRKKMNSSICHTITPPNPEDRGSQLSIAFTKNMKEIHSKLHLYGLVCDYRHPCVIRIAPCPLYNSFLDVWKTISIITEVLEYNY
uniref:Kynureninase n=1 Tax=Lepeophtheirus salmonis TaxID=72036 RepID=D3PK52_LEPSM|nr:Kynureninase [Lepeophtheirus salmonis]